MSIDYTTTNTGIFSRLGRIIYYIFARVARADTDLPAELTAISGRFEAANMSDQIPNVNSLYTSFRSSVTQEKQALARLCDAVLTDKETVLDELRTTARDASGVLPDFIRQMIADGKTVDASTVSIGSISPDAGNKGNGTILFSKLLDGYNKPLASGPAILEYAGVNSELAISETMDFVCTRDNARDGATEGSEGFSWAGRVARDQLGYGLEGSGTGPALTACGTTTLITNGLFETWSGNTPSNWTVTAGTIGTHIKKTTAEFYRGTSSIHFDGDNSQATIVITQSIAAGRMKSRRLYCVSLRLKASASSGTGAFLCSFTGTGYTASSTEKIAISAGSMPTSWTLYSFFIVTPAVIPADWTLSISNTGTPGATSDVYVDCVTPIEATYHGGIAAVVVPGSNKFAAGDRFSVAITNDAAGTFQEFFRQWYRVQLPSNSAGSENISDSLVA